jgi:TetR/AcrR family tetracycline transcriptional repressor
VTGDRLTKAAVAGRALRLADEEGLEAVTVRRLAKELGVTPMALYWHFKNKDELLLGVVDHALSQIRADAGSGDPWPKRLRSLFETVISVMREHPALPGLLHSVDKTQTESFTRATNDTLALLADAGFTVDEGYWVAMHLLNSAMGIVAGQPGCPPTMPNAEMAEWRRKKQLEYSLLPADRYPKLIEYATSFTAEPDLDRYYAFCVDLVIAGVETMAVTRRD